MSSLPNNDITALLLSFMDAIRGNIQSRLSESSSLMHIKALDFIARAKEPSMRDVAEFLMITSPGATMVVDKLVANEEIDRRADADDRRIVRLVITARGRETLDTGMNIVKEYISQRLSVLNKTEQKQFSLLLKKII